jgi:two-component system, NarL family, sensor kinase
MRRIGGQYGRSNFGLHSEGLTAAPQGRTQPPSGKSEPARRSVSVTNAVPPRLGVEDELRSDQLIRLQEEDRLRIEELHEWAAQEMDSIARNLSLVAQSSRKLDMEARKLLTESIDLAGQCAREIRALSYLLHPAMLDRFGLAVTLQGYAESFARQSGIPVSLKLPPDLGRISRELENTIFRMVQEGLASVRRHSHSRAVAIGLTCEHDRVVLEIKDEGAGLSGEASKTMEQGGRAAASEEILSLRRRVKALGGELLIQRDRDGTTLTAVLPIPPVETPPLP